MVHYGCASQYPTTSLIDAHRLSTVCLLGKQTPVIPSSVLSRFEPSVKALTKRWLIHHQGDFAQTATLLNPLMGSGGLIEGKRLVNVNLKLPRF